MHCIHSTCLFLYRAESIHEAVTRIMRSSRIAGESEAKVRELFREAAELAPCIVFIGESCIPSSLHHWQSNTPSPSFITLGNENRLTLHFHHLLQMRSTPLPARESQRRGRWSAGLWLRCSHAWMTCQHHRRPQDGRLTATGKLLTTMMMTAGLQRHFPPPEAMLSLSVRASCHSSRVSSPNPQNWS